MWKSFSAWLAVLSQQPIALASVHAPSQADVVERAGTLDAVHEVIQLARAQKTHHEKANGISTARKVIQRARKQRGQAKRGDLPPAQDASTADPLAPMLVPIKPLTKPYEIEQARHDYMVARQREQQIAMFRKMRSIRVLRKKQDDERQRGEFESHREQAHARNKLPQNGKVAIVVRGQAFRGAGQFAKGCNSTTAPHQFAQARSMVKQVIRPLQKFGNTVSLFMAESSGPCPLVKNLTQVYNANGTVEVFAYTGQPVANQGDALRLAMKTFETDSPIPASGYALVIVTRHDIFWKIPVDLWMPTKNFQHFNFYSKCEPKAPISDCVNDIVWTMPGNMTLGFVESLYTKNCFSFDICKKASGCHGHGCKKAMLNLTKSAESFLTTWHPYKTVRELNSPLLDIQGFVDSE
eukprot:TRINITY_DN32122_c0_g1_i1.p1 TRINITY_DN32122_c0_g1~~TRINITY_DN32122_c0_g1_i1.p1  ORF type:complete len:409 (+),score=66.86 TRINITY_DN32122_c0_g1_i1:145-1371(+)